MIELHPERLFEVVENVLILAGALSLLYALIGFPLAMWWHIFRAPVSLEQNPFDLLNVLDPRRQ